MMKLAMLFRLPRRLARENAGAGALELGLALPMLMLLFVGMIDMSRVISNRIDAEQAAQRVTDYALAVRPPDGRTTYLYAEANRVMDSNADTANIQIFLECNGTRQDSFNEICDAGQDSARFVSVSIVRDVDLLFDWAGLSALFGHRMMGSSISVRGDSIVRFQ